MKLSVRSGQVFTNKELSNEEYRAKAGLSSTDIKEAKKSLAHFKALIDGQRDITPKQRERFDLGTCAHSVILEKSTDDFIKGPDVSSKAVKAWKEFVDANPDKIVLTPEEYSKVIALYGSFMAHPVANKILSPCVVEHNFFHEDHEHGLLLKARVDGYCQDDINGDYIVDYKTTVSAHPEDFSKSIYSYGYHISAAHYSDVIEMCTGRKVRDVFFIAQEISFPYCVAIYRLSIHTLRLGQSVRAELLEKIAKGYKENSFPGYETKIQDIEIPAWAIQKTLNEEVTA